MNQEDYNPNSRDAMTAKIISRLDNQDHTASVWRAEQMDVLRSIKDAVDKTNGRVTALEREKWQQRGFAAAVSMMAAAAWQWITSHK